MALLGNLTGSAPFFQDSGAFYNGVATQSLRFDDGSSHKLTRTFSSSVDNNKKMTISVWAKRANVGTGSTQVIIANYDGIRFLGELAWDGTDILRFDPGGNGDGASNSYRVDTTAVFRDVGSWYHIVLAYDTTQATDTNRVKLYVNGTQQTLTAPSGQSFPPLNYGHLFSYAGANNTIGEFGAGFNTGFLDGYLSEFNFVDGLALDPTSFGETKNGVWIPKQYSGSYGTNGFRLQFNQTGTGSGSSSTVGADTSGNDNHFSSSGIVASDCAMPDSPELNWSTMNSLINGYGTNITMSEGNLAGTGTSAQYNNTLGTILMTSGKWYWEITSANFNNYIMLGIAIETALQTTDSTPYGQTGVVAYATHGAVYNESNSGTGSYASFQGSEIIGIAVDLDASPRTFKFYNNNTLQGTINLSSNFDDIGILPFFCIGTADTIKVNFGQDSSFAGLKTAQGNTDGNDIGDFYYSPPSGYLALCSANLPEPTIGANSDTQPDDYFNTVTFTGTGSTRSVTGVGFQPDWSWFKRRDGAVNHALYDVIRGGTNALRSNTNSAEAQFGDAVVTFETDGFEIAGTNVSGINGSSESIVSWNWKAGGTAVSNTDGTITSSVSANTDAGFSIVTYTGDSTGNDGTPSTIGHGLGAVPKFIFTLPRDTYDGAVYHAGNTTAPETDRLILKSTSGTLATADDASFWNDTAPTSTVFSVGTRKHTNSNGGMVAYCFAEIEGYSKFGSYTGNGNADGTFVYTGFRPAWVMQKRTNSTGDWHVLDNKRNTFNEVENYLYANLSDAEYAGNGNDGFDYLSNGFKLSNTYTALNASGGTYIYMAFAENPFKYANAR